MKRRTVLAGLAVGVTFAAATFTGAGVSQARAVNPRQAPAKSHRASAAPFDSNLARQHDQIVAINHFRAIAAAAPDRFAGISTQGPAHVSVNLAGNPAMSVSDVAAITREAATVGITVSFPVRKHSLRELTRIQDAATHDASLTAAATAPISAALDPDTNSIRITSTGVTESLRTRAHMLFGDAVTVSADVPATDALGRFNDVRPFFGGDRIANPSGACTYGFGITNKFNIEYAITAGHCWPIGEDVSAATQFGGTNNLGTGYANFGTVQFRAFGGGTPDSELIGNPIFNPYAGLIWVGEAPSSSIDAPFAPVHDALDSCAQCNVLFDGSFTGVSSATVDSNPNCVQFPSGLSCGIWLAHSTNGQRICQGGDSGGPVFSFDGRGGVTAVGIIKACDTTGTHAAYTSMPYILTYWVSTLITYTL